MEEEALWLHDERLSIIDACTLDLGSRVTSETGVALIIQACGIKRI